jgi:tRNA G18 (ribose-2'-O)-methylase SpoU
LFSGIQKGELAKMFDISKINDIDNQQLDIYIKIPERQLLTANEPAPGIFIAESMKVLERALGAGFEPISLVAEDKNLQELTSGESALSGKLLSATSDTALPVFTADENTLDKITGYHLTGGCLCAMKRKELPHPGEVLRNAKRIVILENVMNPTNVGAIFRSAAALFMDAVLLTHSCADPLYRRCIRVSMGNVFLIPWTFIDSKEMTWPGQGLEYLNSLGFKTVSMALRNESVSISDPALKSAERLALIMGSEGDGLLTETIDKSDYVAKIPMAPGVDSLNVAAASALAFWEIA